MKNIFGLTASELENELVDEKKFRSKQIIEWLYKKNVSSFDDMKNLPKSLREKLSSMFEIQRAELVTKLESKDLCTKKFLLKFADGVAVETVAMKHDYGNSVCVSSQAGCSMGCKFCASTINGVERNLTAGEMLEQIFYAKDSFDDKKIDSIVVMGSGEPMMNFSNVVKFLRLTNEFLGLSFRSMTVSTSGIVPRIYDLIEEKIPITLSISLHAPIDDLRSELMPVNRTFPLKDLIQAGKTYGDRTSRRVTYEYLLIDHLNDSKEHAEILSRLLKNQLANVNLIPFNPVIETGFKKPSTNRVETFEKILQSRGISVTIRKEMGSDINAACGQLRNKFLN